ncbi:helix-turn-helix transcriptional regulator [Lignipirellula cremea]|uniref:HTH domain protein n=1 Tax=Lignipirellula cremea TaxID=2528010 RepID=A0A518E4Z7_9BACT|nr:WYL domain-containing protein [Lignipirellula cremea]QDU99162.1 HTH domain protein [Lignipirellula cremea]
MAGQSPLERQWLILRTLCARRYGATIRELADEYEVSPRTIQRDLGLLRDLGFPLEPQGGPHGRNHWVATHDAQTPPFSFDVSEILGLYLGRALLEPLAGTVVWDSANTAFRKIKASLGEAALAYFGKLNGLIHRTAFRDSQYAEKSQIIDDLMVGVEDQRMTFITYQSARSTEPLTYDVYPYGLVYHRGSLYLVAMSQHHEEIRTFKLDRITDVGLENLTFQRPADFRLQEYLQHSLGIYRGDGEPQRVVVRFAPEVSRYVAEHHWHHSQRLIPQKDGWLRFEVELASLAELKSWVLGFGAKAMVLEPTSLRDEILAEAQAMLENAAAAQRKASPQSAEH